MAETKLIIFDLDGTLVDAYGAITRSFNDTMARLGLERRSVGAIRKAVGWGDESLLKPFVGRGRLKEALAFYRLHHKQALLSYSRVYPHVRRVLGELKKRGIKLAIASNRPTRFSLILVRHLKLDGLLDYILCADRLRYAKPHPQILRKIMKKFRVLPAQTSYVGDMAIDAECARRAGVRAFIVTTGSSSRKEIKKERPYRIMRDTKELLKAL